MPRKKSPARLYLDRKRGQWVIRDGQSFHRTGCSEEQRERAERVLESYLGQRHKPEGGPSPLITDVLLVYAQEHLPHTKSAGNAVYNIANLAGGFGGLRLSDISARTCRAYARERSDSAARRDLETLRAAVRYYAREHGPLGSVPSIVLPPKAEPRSRWLSKTEAALLLKAARRTEHLRRFILLGLYTGTRSGNLLRLKWDQIDLSAGVMARVASGEAQDAKKRAPAVRLGRRIISHLRRWLRRDRAMGVEYVCHYEGAPIKKLRRSWAAAIERAGLGPDVTPHTLRHTRATWLMQAGIDPWEAAGHLGMTVETLERTYGHHHPSFQQRAAEV
jgi:integrase